MDIKSEDLKYLTNMNYNNVLLNHNNIAVSDTDIKLYRKEVLNITKKLLRGTKIDNVINKSYLIYIKDCINYIKLKDCDNDNDNDNNDNTIEQLDCNNLEDISDNEETKTITGLTVKYMKSTKNSTLDTFVNKIPE